MWMVFGLLGWLVDVLTCFGLCLRCWVRGICVLVVFVI